MKIIVEQIKNGPEINILPTQANGLCFFQFDIFAGHLDDPRGQSGLSHLVEHMILMSTRNGIRGWLDQEMQMNAALVNAEVRDDITSIYAYGPGHDSSIYLDLLAQAVFSTKIKKTDVHKEKKVVLCEMLQDLDNPESMLDNLARSDIYLNEPFSRPIEGLSSEFVKLSWSDVQDHYSKYFLPNNCRIIVIGNVYPDKIKEQASSLVAIHETSKRKKTPKLNNQGTFFHKANWLKTTYIRISYSIPVLDQEKSLALEILVDALFNESCSPAYRELRISRSLIYSLEGTSLSQVNHTLVQISVQCAEKNTDTVVDVIHNCFRIWREDPESFQAAVKASKIYSTTVTDHSMLDFKSAATLISYASSNGFESISAIDDKKKSISIKKIAAISKLIENGDRYVTIYGTRHETASHYPKR